MCVYRQGGKLLFLAVFGGVLYDEWIPFFPPIFLFVLKKFFCLPLAFSLCLQLFSSPSLFTAQHAPQAYILSLHHVAITELA